MPALQKQGLISTFPAAHKVNVHTANTDWDMQAESVLLANHRKDTGCHQDAIRLQDMQQTWHDCKMGTNLHERFHSAGSGSA